MEITKHKVSIERACELATVSDDVTLWHGGKYAYLHVGIKLEGNDEICIFSKYDTVEAIEKLLKSNGIEAYSIRYR